MLRPALSLIRYVLRGAVVALLGSLLLGGLAFLIVHQLGLWRPSLGAPDRSVTVSEAVGMVLLAPLLETPLLALTLWPLRRLLRVRVRVVTAAAVVWGVLHGLQGPMWFFGTVWSFFVFASGWEAYRGRSFGHAFAAAALPHALVNAAAFTMIAMATPLR